MVHSETIFDLVFPGMAMGENTVLCPFHFEKTPSMNINTVQKIYHCFGCGAHGNENDFIEQYYGISKDQVAVFKEALLKSESLHDYDHFSASPDDVQSNFTYMELVRRGISPALLEDLNVGIEVSLAKDEATDSITFIPQNTKRLVWPIIIKNRVLDTRAYSISSDVMPKSKSKAGAPAGLILPYHLWVDDESPTVVCEGEKDMTFARNAGFNAISLGGCNNLPNILINNFKDKKVYIVYDNDNAGRAGALKLASALYEVTKEIFIADIGKYVKENKEDITDFFTKYSYTGKDFQQLLDDAVFFDTTSQEQYIRDSYPKVTLNEASTTHLGKVVRSDIQVMATYEDQYSVPSYATFKKEKTGGKDEFNRVNIGTTEYWTLTKSNFDDILILTDNNLKRPQIVDNLKSIIGWGNEENVLVNITNPKTIFKAQIADNTESIDAEEIKRTEFVCYSDIKLEAGKNYQLIYKVVPHPYKGQQQVIVATSVKESTDTITSFEVNEHTIKDLQAFHGMSFLDIVKKQKAYVKFDVDNRLLEFIDLWYHTPASFSFGYHKNIRGYLDGLIIAESRVGKSSTAKALSEVYEVGAIASLAGSAATPAGLIGGSVRTGTSSQIRPGLIPRNHNRSIIFEELAKAKYSLLPELTDIRSSGIVRINRATGDLTLPASVRMLFLSNPKSGEDAPSRPIIAYPNGLEIIKDLIGSIEDIARFDFIYILGTEPQSIDPVWFPPEGFTPEQLKTRIRWIWSRKENQVIIPDKVQQFIVAKSKEYNEMYMNSTKVFSTETWKKIARLAIAIAGYTVSTDMEFNNIIVTETHVTIAGKLLQSIYDNDIFKLKQFTDEERKKLYCSTGDVMKIKDLKVRFPAVIQYLENNSSITKSTLFTISGVDTTVFNDVMQNLSKDYFIELSRDKIYPTPKLLMTFRKLNELRED
jgi:DNA primase